MRIFLSFFKLFFLSSKFLALLLPRGEKRKEKKMYTKALKHDQNFSLRLKKPKNANQKRNIDITVCLFLFNLVGFFKANLMPSS